MEQIFFFSMTGVIAAVSGTGIYNILELQDGNLVISGFYGYVLSSSYNKIVNKCFLRKIDAATGRQIWSHFYVLRDSTNVPNLGNMHELPDHSLHVHFLPPTNDITELDNSYWHFDSAGNFIEWKRIVPGSTGYTLGSHFAGVDGQGNEVFYANVSGSSASYPIIFKASNDAVSWAQAYTSTIGVGYINNFATATIGSNSILIGGNYATHQFSTNDSREEYQSYLIKTDETGETSCSDTFSIPLAIITSTDPLFQYPAVWSEAGGTSVAFDSSVKTSDLLPQELGDCPVKNSDTVVHVDATLCTDSIYTLPNDSIVTQPGIYHNYFQTAAGCDSVIFTNLTQETAPAVQLGNDTCFTNTSAITLYAKTNNTNDTFLWQDGSSNSTYNAAQAGIYWVQASNSCGVATDSVTIYSNCNLPVYVPNAFTPNNDGLNDVFRIANINNQQFVDMSIYNRWGQRIFYSTEALKGWDGKQNGVELPASTFIYQIRYKNFAGKLQSLKGTVVLMR
ncbi:gliding motility-associated C-terminal domain-containing protein [Parafilimonas sp.]|uniref:gliding motility-associated C-terminal domain-containing protein n=1 Tax=Parafilimonas sp. TaxID=1969739 RepID=UPI0039E720B0